MYLSKEELYRMEQEDIKEAVESLLQRIWWI